MAISKSNLVRLLGSVIALALSAFFVVFYSHYSRILFLAGNPGAALVNVNEMTMEYARWGFALPIFSLAMGLWLLIAHPRSHAAFEVVVNAAWLLAFSLALLCILCWQLQNIPGR